LSFLLTIDGLKMDYFDEMCIIGFFPGTIFPSNLSKTSIVFSTTPLLRETGKIHSF
jgi:hypothetical protein